MIARIAFLVDTNVLVYSYDSRDLFKWQRAVDVLARLEQEARGAISTQIAGEFFNTVTRRIPRPLSAAEGERALTTLVRTWQVFDLTFDVVLEAVRGVQRYQFSYWDALIWATAKLNGVPTVLSEDFNDGALLENVRFRNPFAAGFAITSL